MTFFTDDGYATIKISSKMARLPFNGCTPDYISTVCHASCCQSSIHPSGTMISVLPNEEAMLMGRGADVVNGFLQPINRRCPFKTKADLCSLHQTPDKPFGCVASPFTLNSNDTLIVRNRYIKLKCYNDGRKLPAYIAFRASLDLILGRDESAHICEHLDGDGGDTLASISIVNRNKLLYNDATKKG